MSVFRKGKIYMIERMINFLSSKPYFTQKFFSNNRDLLLKEYFEYPSVINNGFLHIERVISLAKILGRTENKIIIDAGAANGVISKKFSDAFPHSKVYSFEPIKATYEELVKTTEGNKNIIRINKAIGSMPGTSVINVLNRITSSSILDVNKRIADPVFSGSLKQANTEAITISTLDSEIPFDNNVSILKMDVQGYELEILKGGTETLKRTDILLLEMQNHHYYTNAPMYFDLDKFLREQNFSFWDIIPSLRGNNKLKEWDAIYVSNRFTTELGVE